MNRFRIEIEGFEDHRSGYLANHENMLPAFLLLNESVLVAIRS
jgi:hypothetical protein